MRKLLLALGVLALVTAPAFAVNLGSGEHTAKLEDHSALFYDNQGTTDVRGLSTPPNIFVGDEQRTIFRITTIKQTATGDIEFDTSSSTELTGVLYDLEVVGIYTPMGATGPIYLDFAPLGRNPLTSRGADVDGDSLASFGGVVEVYEDATKDYTSDPAGAGLLQSALPAGPAGLVLPANAGPRQWVEGTAGVSADAFPTVTDGSLWLSAQFVDMAYLIGAGLIVDPIFFGEPAFTAGTVMREVINPFSGVGHGFAYGNVFGGSAAGEFERSYFGDLVDMAMVFDVYTPQYNPFLFPAAPFRDTTTYAGPGFWPVDSQDPITFATIIPEPTSLALLGLGMAGLGVIRRRRK